MYINKFYTDVNQDDAYRNMWVKNALYAEVHKRVPNKNK